MKSETQNKYDQAQTQLQQRNTNTNTNTKKKNYKAFRCGGKDVSPFDNTFKVIWSVAKSRSSEMKVLLKMEKGEYFDSPGVFYARTTEAVIEPLQEKPPLGIDGERLPVKPTYLKMLPNRILLCV